MQKRTAALIAGASAAVAMTITGVTYASAEAPQSAASVQEAVRPATAPLGGDSDYDYKKDYREAKKDGGDSDYDYKKDYREAKKNGGEIQINERTYTANPGACVAVVRPALTSFNITNNTDRIVQFFSGNNCNAGAPVATVLPGGSQFGVVGTVTSSFRVIDN